MTVTITLPLPPPELNPNKPTLSVRGRMGKNRATKDYREHAMVAVTARFGTAWKPRWKRATIQVEYYFKTAAFRDPDNCLASLKAAFDGLTDSGLLADDRDVNYLPVKRAKDAGNPRVVIHISDTISIVKCEACEEKAKTIEVMESQIKCGAWVECKHRLPDSGRVLVFSPLYSVGDPTRFRVMDAQFVRISTEATHWMDIDAISPTK